MKKFTKIMKALSDPSRVKIMKMIQSRESLCVCELTAALGLAQPTVSKHLKILEEAGLAEGTREGAWVNYSAPAAPESPYAEEMLRLLGGWLDDEPEVASVLSQIQGISRETLCTKS